MGTLIILKRTHIDVSCHYRTLILVLTFDFCRGKCVVKPFLDRRERGRHVVAAGQLADGCHVLVSVSLRKIMTKLELERFYYVSALGTI